MSDEIRVGPTFLSCPECGGSNTDGYDRVVHYATCSKAPTGKRAKMEPTMLREEDLPEELRAILFPPDETDPPPTPHGSES